MRLLARRDTGVHKSTSSHLGGTGNHSLQNPAQASEEYVAVAEKFRLAKAWGQCVDCDVELGDRMVAGEVADREDLEELADVVSIVHASLLGVVQSIEDVGGVALGKLQSVS